MKEYYDGLQKPQEATVLVSIFMPNKINLLEMTKLALMFPLEVRCANTIEW